MDVEVVGLLLFTVVMLVFVLVLIVVFIVFIGLTALDFDVITWGLCCCHCGC